MSTATPTAATEKAAAFQTKAARASGPGRHTGANGVGRGNDGKKAVVSACCTLQTDRCVACVRHGIEALSGRGGSQRHDKLNRRNKNTTSRVAPVNLSRTRSKCATYAHAHLRKAPLDGVESDVAKCTFARDTRALLQSSRLSPRTMPRYSFLSSSVASLNFSPDKRAMYSRTFCAYKLGSAISSAVGV